MVVPHISPELSSPEDEKRMLRSRMRALRQARPAAPSEVAALREALWAVVRARNEDCVAGVWPLPGELDLTPLWHQVHDMGRQVLLPETPQKGMALVFRRWRPGITMIEGRFGTHYPDGPVARPRLVLVPLLAFDRALNRLGYGGGYYDRSLAGLNCPAIGFALSWQEVVRVPVEAFDYGLDAVVTEREVITATDGRV